MTKIKAGPVRREWAANKLFVADGPNLSQNLRESNQERVGHGPVWPTRSAATASVSIWRVVPPDCIGDAICKDYGCLINKVHVAIKKKEGRLRLRC